MNTASLSKDVASNNRSVPGITLPGNSLNHDGGMLEFLFNDSGRSVRVVVDRHDKLGERLIPCTFPQSIDCDMNPADTGLDRSEAVRRDKSVIIMSMKIQESIRHHRIDPVQILRNLIGCENSKCVRQHDPLNLHGGEDLQKLVQISEGMKHSIGPVLQIDIDIQTELFRIFNLSAHIVKMLARLFFELNATMIFGTFCQKIEDLSAALMNPGSGFSTVDEPENLHPVEASFVLRPSENGGKSGFFSVGYSCGTDLQAINVQVGNEKTGNLEFFRGSICDAGSLFAVAQCGVEDLYITGVSVLCFHFLPAFLVHCFGTVLKNRSNSYNTTTFPFCKRLLKMKEQKTIFISGSQSHF